MICDNCVCKNKCTKIISEGEKYCRDKRTEDTLFRIGKGCSKDFLKDYNVVWRKYEYRVF